MGGRWGSPVGGPVGGPWGRIGVVQALGRDWNGRTGPGAGLVLPHRGLGRNWYGHTAAWGRIGMAAQALGRDWYAAPSLGRDWNGRTRPGRPHGVLRALGPRAPGPSGEPLGPLDFQTLFCYGATFLAGSFIFWPRQTLIFRTCGNISHLSGKNWSPKVEQKWRFRGLDLSGEIRSGILRRLALISHNMFGWRPHWWQKKCDLGSLGVPGPASTPLGS